MIAEQIKGKDFYGLLAYHEKKAKKGKGYFLDTNITQGKTVEMTKEFNIVRQLRPSLSIAVYHVSLNLPHGDILSDKKFTTMGLEYLRGMGFDDNQYIMYRHIDKEHSHIHIVANRVKFSGDLVSDSKDFERSEILVRELEKTYGLSQLPKVKLIKDATLTQKEIEKTLRTGDAPIKYLLQQNVKTAITNSSNISQFIEALKLKGISPKFNTSKTTGRVSGISFKYQEVIYKGSTLGRKYSWNNIIKYIDYEQDRDRSIILENDIPKRGAKGVAVESDSSTNGSSGKAELLERSSGKIDKKSIGYLEKAQTDRLDKGYGLETNWTPFKLELVDDQSKKKRKRKGKKL